MGQVFRASQKHVEQNGAISWAPGGPFDGLGYFAKVQNCPIDNVEGGIRLTCYATGYADTFFSVPACTRYRGKHIRGYFTGTDDGPVFRVLDSHKHHFDIPA